VLFLLEFQNVDAVSMLLAHSHLFVFFPLFGILALAAFWLPSVVFTDMYWHTIRFGRLRYCAGLLGVGLLAAWTTAGLQSGSPRGIWEIKPEVLIADKGQRMTCGKDNMTCQRAPMLATLGKIRDETSERIGLSKFARVCEINTLLENPVGYDNRRYCFAALDMLSAEACCAAQRQFKTSLDQLYSNPANRSDTARLDAFFLFAKTFFIGIILVIGGLLVFRRSTLENQYHSQAPAIERCLLVGAAALLVWPMMDYAYHQTSLAMFGRMQDGPHFRLSLAIAPWFLLLLFYFLQRLGRKIERWGQVLSVGASGLALYRYDEANDLAVRFLGAGAPVWGLAVMGVAVLLGLIALRYPSRDVLARHRKSKLPPQWT
jgi:hypothetical protein